MRHIDLFSGIGGFALAAKTVWGGAYQNVLFCDNNKFCQRVLRKNFGKDIVIYDDIREVTSNSEIKRRPEEWESSTDKTEWSSRCDLLTGGFPCQPFSAAGKRRGTEDDRYLWPEMLRVIKEFQPTWVVGENVVGLLSMAQFKSEIGVASQTDLFGNSTSLYTKKGRGILFGIVGELEQVGYTVQVFVIPAVAVNAPHRRDRIWIVAYRASIGQRRGSGQECKHKFGGGIQPEKRERNNPRSKGEGRNSDVTNATGSVRRSEQKKQSKERPKMYERSDEVNRHSVSFNAQGLRKQQDCEKQNGLCDRENGEWRKNWIEVATELCGVDDGLSVELDGFKLSKAGHRVERLKALGNAIVPQVAVEIFRAIKKYEEIGI
ncbi:MAG: DNA cytosine methyltransferase [Candidatus Omnitrophota bacterium]|jgi:DNA (cytosine-5)-methyltransferase 1